MTRLQHILYNQGTRNTATADWVIVQDEGQTLVRIPVGRFPITTHVRHIVTNYTGTVVAVYLNLKGHTRYVIENELGASMTTSSDELEEVT